MGNIFVVAWWLAAWEPVQLLAHWQVNFAETWSDVYSPAGAGHGLRAPVN